MREQPWNASKGMAVRWMLTWWGIAVVILWAGSAMPNDAAGGYGICLAAALPFLIAGGLYCWRLVYLINRDKKIAQLSYGETVYHVEAPKPQQPQNRLYVPKSPNQPR